MVSTGKGSGLMLTAVRILFVILGILLLVGGIFLVFITLGVISGAVLFGYPIPWLVGDLSYMALGFLAIVSGVLLVAFLSPRGKKTREGGSIVSFTEMGEVRVSYKAIENMVLTASRQVKGIREVNTRITSTEQGLVIYMRIKTVPDIPIPGLVAELQEKVKSYVQDISGASVAEVKVLVENVAQDKIQKNVR